MVVVSYDISNDKLRTKFAKYLSRFGHRLQYSVFEIDNSEKIVNNIVNDLKNKYEKSFSQEDSVIIFKLSSNITFVLSVGIIVSLFLVFSISISSFDFEVIYWPIFILLKPDIAPICPAAILLLIDVFSPFFKYIEFIFSSIISSL